MLQKLPQLFLLLHELGQVLLVQKADQLIGDELALFFDGFKSLLDLDW